MPTDAFEGEDYADLTCEFLMEKMKRDPMVTTIVAAVPKNIGFTEEKRREAGGQFVDVGIAEQKMAASQYLPPTPVLCRELMTSYRRICVSTAIQRRFLSILLQSTV